VAPYWKTPDEGSSTTLVAALDPALNGERLHRSSCFQGLSTDLLPHYQEIKGLYLYDCHFREPFSHASDLVAAERLWKLSEELVEEKFALDF